MNSSRKLSKEKPQRESHGESVLKNRLANEIHNGPEGKNQWTERHIEMSQCMSERNGLGRREQSSKDLGRGQM